MTLKKVTRLLRLTIDFYLGSKKKKCLYKIIKYVTICEIYKNFSKYLTHCKLRYQRYYILSDYC